MNNSKQLARLMAFTQVAQKQSFTKAAEYLQISKSAVSQQVSLLEKELGTRLLNRTTREISLTAIGESLLERCTVLQDQLALIFSDLAEAELSPKGRFAITYPHSLESTVILPAIEQLCTEFPNLEPVLMADDKPLDIVENKLDIAIHIGELADSSYRAIPLGKVTELFCATPQYINQQEPICSLEDLSQLAWIATSWQNKLGKTKITSSKGIETVQLKEFARANTLPATVGMVLQHLGIALIPDIYAGPLIKSGALVHIGEQFVGPEWPVYSVHAYQQNKPRHITRFHQLIQHSFGRKI